MLSPVPLPWGHGSWTTLAPLEEVACLGGGEGRVSKCRGQGQEAMEMLIARTGYSVKCEYTAHKEGVLKEEMLLACEGGAGTCVRVVVQARVMGESARHASG